MRVVTTALVTLMVQLFKEFRIAAEKLLKNNDFYKSAAAISSSNPKSYGNNMYENESVSQNPLLCKVFCPISSLLFPN